MKLRVLEEIDTRLESNRIEKSPRDIDIASDHATLCVVRTSLYQTFHLVTSKYINCWFLEPDVRQRGQRFDVIYERPYTLAKMSIAFMIQSIQQVQSLQSLQSFYLIITDYHAKHFSADVP